MNQKPQAVAKATKAAEPAERKVGLQADFGEVYVAVRGGQIMAPVRAQMTLYQGLGHLYRLPGTWNAETKRREDTWHVTASGYRHLNKVAAISLVTPHEVIVDGRAMPNPYIERDDKTKAISAVNIRRMGIGFAPTGNVVVIDKTLFYNVYTYFIQSIQAKMGREKWAGGKSTGEKENPNTAIYGVAEKEPEIEGSWVFFPTVPPIGIWLNILDRAAQEVLEEHTQRQRFGDRMASTIIDRNILKDHPAIAVSQVFAKQGTSGMAASVTVYGFRSDINQSHIRDIMRQVEAGEGDDDLVVKRETIEDVTPEEEKAAASETAQEVGGDIPAGPAPAAEPAK